MKEVSLKKLLVIAGIGWLFDAMDVGLLSFIMAAVKVEWNLSAGQVGWIASVNSIGMAVGALFFGMMADRIGRKNVFMITLILFSVAGGLSALASSLTVFLILRFFVGMGLGGELPVASTLVSESAPEHQKARFVVLLESFWAVGWIISAIIAFFIIPQYGWRVAVIICALPALYAFYLRINLPDSPQFIKKEKSLSIMESVKMVWQKEHFRSTLMLWILWFTVIFSYYGMFLWLPSVMVIKGFSLIKSFSYILIMSLAQLPGYFSAAWLIEKMGRKFVLITYLIGTAICAYSFGQAETLTVLIIFGMLLSFFNLGAWGAMYAYTPENYPAHIRGTGVGMAASFGRIGGILGPLFVGFFINSMTFVYSVFCIAIVVGVLAVAFLGKETKS